MCNFLAIDDFTSKELENLLSLASKLKKEFISTGNQPVLNGKTLAMIFQKPSLRTRVSFEMAMHHLGGKSIYLSPQEIELGKRESVPDVARVLDGYVDAIMARVFNYDQILELAKYTSIPVINGLSDYNHPCQALGDMLTIMELKPKLQGLKLTFVGDGNNVATSLALTCALMDIDFTIASPKGYELNNEVIDRIKKISLKQKMGFLQMTDPIAAVSNADIIYTDVWTSMGQEQEAHSRQELFKPYQVNQDLVSKAKPNVIVMHDLPAKRGEEITSDVADGPNSVIFQQAHNRMHSAKAILHTLLTD
ncbi:MAG: ornithine carbamoyltransferase [Anaerolineaceae bacterium]|nr:ornithine carbamoyltransferase [Anaerolineaceae bacterium]|tara:strand:- start:12483 stop:13403 length:921 start_codon:yes stop_codon:yes gene_type:complete